jgi:hypothetical protein
MSLRVNILRILTHLMRQRISYTTCAIPKTTTCRPSRLLVQRSYLDPARCLCNSCLPCGWARLAMPAEKAVHTQLELSAW